GRLQQFATPMNLYNLTANRFVAEFVGNPGMNFIEGSIDHEARRFTNDHLALALSDAQFEGLKNQRRVALGIRAEHMELSCQERDGWMPASVYVTELMGNETFVF